MITQPNQETAKPRLHVRIYYHGIPMGFYRARTTAHEGLFLEHGPIVFPTGCDVHVEFLDPGQNPRFRLAANVENTDSRGMQLKFQ